MPATYSPVTQAGKKPTYLLTHTLTLREMIKHMWHDVNNWGISMNDIRQFFVLFVQCKLLQNKVTKIL